MLGIAIANTFSTWDALAAKLPSMYVRGMERRKSAEHGEILDFSTVCLCPGRWEGLVDGGGIDTIM